MPRLNCLSSLALPRRAGSRCLAGNGAALLVSLVGQSGMGGFPADFRSFSRAPLGCLLFGLPGQCFMGSSRVTFALQRLGDRLRTLWIGLVRVPALAFPVGELSA